MQPLVLNMNTKRLLNESEEKQMGELEMQSGLEDNLDRLQDQKKRKSICDHCLLLRHLEYLN